VAATAQELATLLAQRASEVEEACVGLDGDSAAKRPAPDAWCIREHLSHLNGEDRYGYVDGIRSILFEEVRELDVEPGITHYNTDRRQIALPVLVSAVAGQYRAIADLASRMTDEELGTRVGIDLLKDTPFGPVPTLAEWLTAIGEMHVPGHIAEIREIRAALGA
jgi:hypothetical protein